MADNNVRCENCRWFTANKKKPVPPKPKLTRRFLGIEWQRDSFVVALEEGARWAVIFGNMKGTCSRFPKLETKHRADLCGEFTPTETGGE